MIITLAGLFLLACFASWASKSIPRAIVFVALLGASPFIGMGLLYVIAFEVGQQQQTIPHKASLR